MGLESLTHGQTCRACQEVLFVVAGVCVEYISTVDDYTVPCVFVIRLYAIVQSNRRYHILEADVESIGLKNDPGGVELAGILVPLSLLDCSLIIGLVCAAIDYNRFPLRLGSR